MAPLSYIGFLVPKWPVLMMASVLSLLHLEFSPLLFNYDTKNLLSAYDFIIVGGGTAGCLLANRLSADPRRTVLLIEAGNVENAATDVPLFALLHFHGYYDWDYRTEPQKHACLGMNDNRCNWARGKALGGSSVTNFMLYVRGNSKDFDLWEKEHGAKGWSYKDVLPYFKKFESYRDPEADSDYRGLHGELPVTHAATKTKLVPAFLKAGEELGFKVIDYNGAEQTGFSAMQSTILKGHRYSSAKSFITPIISKRSANLHITLLSQAIQVLFDNNRAMGVKFIKNGAGRTVRAKREVILSAGAIGSAQLLLLSGVGPKEDLDKLGIPIVADLPVGNNLQDHLINLGMAATTTSNVEIWPQSITAAAQYAFLKSGPFSLPAGIETTAFTNTSFASRDHPDVQIYVLSISGASVEGERFMLDVGVRKDIYDAYYRPKRGSNAFHLAVALNRLKSRGFVKLRSKDYSVPPIIEPKYFTHPDDIRMATEALSQGLRILKTKAFSALGTQPWNVHLPPCRRHAIWSTEYMQCMARHLSPTGWHPCCTNPMGAGPKAVLDSRLRVRGNISALRVVDASIMPDITSGNLNAPTFMIAEKGAAMILEDNK